MRIFNKFKRKFLYILRKSMKPEMIGIEYDFKGLKLQGTSISNSTHVSNQSSNLKLENNVFIGHFNYIDANNAEIIIKSGVQITNYVSILTHSSHNEIRIPEIRNSTKEIYEKLMNINSVFIGENSYIGPHSVIMPGTKIGKGCIISAFSYVSGDVPDYSIVRGIPGKVVGSTQDIDQKILNENPSLGKNYYSINNAN
jgi:acetyltransferase-like isoleucine patch superfamily enzyme